MNEKKFCFIMCSNNKRYTDECLYYINQLNIPEGYEVDVLTVEDARSMTAGYNEAMYSSDAKYKIYIHQDTFIIYRDVLYEIVRFFAENPQVGMIGVIGRIGDNPDAVFWNAWNCGRTRAWNAYQEIDLDFQEDDTDIPDVKAIDGMFMATQYDIRWREDVIPGWDYYDISQSCEFIRRGYQIAVPYQKQAWCLHDCGVNELRQYDVARRNFCEVYQEFGYCYQESESQGDMSHRYQVLDSVVQLMPKLIEQNEFTAIEMMLKKTSELRVNLTELLMIECIMGIRKLEQSILGHSLFWEGCHSYRELIDKFTEIKFELQRVEYGLRQEDSRLERWYAEGKLSKECMDYMINFCVYERDNVWNKIKNTPSSPGGG